MTIDYDGVVAIADAVRSGEVRATEVSQFHLERAEASQSSLNAFTLIDQERALATAAAVDARVERGEDPGSLAGVPIAVKDLIEHAGRPNTRGAGFAPPTPQQTAPCISRLEDAGAVVIGRCGLHEFAFGFSSENHWFGPVHNPWDTSLSPGGSSGGSAAAVAAHLAAGSLGTDTGGSVRVPAALCGIVGLKVTHGRIPLSGVYPLAASFDTVGPLARSVADAAALYLPMTGHHPADPWSQPQVAEAPGGALEITSLRVGVPHPWVDTDLSLEQGAAFDAALDAMEDVGATVVHLQAPDLDPPGQIEGAMYPEIAGVHGERFRAEPEGYGPETAKRLEDVMGVDVAAAERAKYWRNALRGAMNDALSTVDVLATPTVTALRKEIGRDLMPIAGAPVFYRTALSKFTSLVNAAGHPAIALPLSAAGTPPPSLQLIGKPWEERLLLEAGLALERSAIVSTRRPKDW